MYQPVPDLGVQLRATATADHLPAEVAEVVFYCFGWAFGRLFGRALNKWTLPETKLLLLLLYIYI